MEMPGALDWTPWSMTATAVQDLPEDRTAIDAALVRRMSGGDRDALAELYDRFSRPLFSTAFHILKDSAESQDIVHDVFLVLWEKAAQFEETRGSAFSWAVTLTRNRSIDRLRARRRRAGLLEKSAPSDLGYDEGAGASGAVEHASAGDEASAVRSAVAALPPDQKRALELAFFSGLTQQEIAGQLQEPLGTVKARIRRGLLKLRDSLPHRL